jgi:hypothetical protein
MVSCPVDLREPCKKHRRKKFSLLLFILKAVVYFKGIFFQGDFSKSSSE